jgi:hypothetical protein
MPELSDIVAEVKTPSYLDVLAKDLNALLEVGYALRSVPEDELVRWLDGKECWGMREKHPLPESVKYVGQPTIGLTKEYETIGPSGQHYRFVVTPKHTKGICNNEVRVKFFKEYPDGQNGNIGELVSSKDHNVLYLLPLISRLPIKEISYKAVVDFLEKHNGFRIMSNSMETAAFQDSYKHEIVEIYNSEPLKLKFPDGNVKQVSPNRGAEIKKTVDMDVLVVVNKVARPKYHGIGIALEVILPEKRVW